MRPRAISTIIICTIASIGTIPTVSIRHEPQLSGSFAALAPPITKRFIARHVTILSWEQIAI